jgi:hypothetical protein
MSAFCPKCGYSMDKVLSNAARERKPQPGDFALCFNCAAICAFTDDLGLRCANAQELDDLNFDETIIASQMTIRAESDWESAANDEH